MIVSLRPLKVVYGVCAAILFAGCTTNVPSLLRTPTSSEPAAWKLVSPDQALVMVLDAGVVLVRGDRTTGDQRIGLPNRTAVSGDNVLHVRAIPITERGPLDLDRAIDRIGGIPQPFARSDLSALRSITDSAGSISWAEWTDGAGTTCVLALRRVTDQMRVLPRGMRAVDLVLRNCVRAPAATALEPLGPNAVRFGASGGADGPGSVRTLSPLAGPKP